MVLRPSLKRGVPGSVPPWRAPCFSWPCRGFGLPGVFFVALPWFSTSNRSKSWPSRWGCCQSRFSLGSSFQLGLRLIKLTAAKVYFCSFFQVETRSSGRRQGQETHRRAARGLLRFPDRSVFLRFSQSRRRPVRRGARSVEKASLTSAQLSAFAFPLKLYCKALLSSSFVRANRAHGCCCWQAFAGHRALSLSSCLASAARPKFGFLFYVTPATCCGWPLVMGSGRVGLRSKL